MFHFPTPPFQSYHNPGLYSEADYLDSVARHAAHDYAIARVRVEAIERARPRVQQPGPPCFGYHHRQPHTRVSLDTNNSYGRQSGYPRFAPSAPVEEVAFSVWREEEYLRAEIVRQREAQRARAIAEAAARQEAQRRLQAERLRQQQQRLRQQQFREQQLKERQLREQQAFVALLLLGAASSAPQSAPSQHAGKGTPLGHHVLSPAPASPLDPSVNVDRKGKGKAVEVPVERHSTTSAVKTAPVSVPTLKEELEARIRNEADPQIQESLVLLYSDLFDTRKSSPDAQPAAGPSNTQHEPQPPTPVEQPQPSPESNASAATPTPPTEGANLHRTPALPPAVAEKLLKFYHARRARKLSLDQIQEVEEALRKLEGAFEFPEHLDFVNPLSSAPTPASGSEDEVGPLAYTPNNTPVHAYEHALNALLTRLDAVESGGDLEVRGRRKEVVREVERALEAMERRVEESRERERERSRERARRASATSVDTAQVETEAQGPEAVAGEEAKATPVSEPVHYPETSTVPSVVVDSVLDPALDPATAVDTPASDLPETLPGAAPSESQDHAASPAESFQVPVDDTQPADETVTTVDAIAATETDISTPPPVQPDSPVVISEDESPTSSSDVTDASSPTTLSTDEDSTSPPETSSDADSDLIEVPASITPTSPTNNDILAPEAITRTTSTTTDATFVTAEESVPSSAQTQTPPLPDAEPEPMTRAPSGGGDPFLLTSHPLADPESTKKPSSTQGVEDELEIISSEELEAAKNDSDWSEVESDASVGA